MLRRSLLLVVLLALLWGSSYALMKVAVETIPPVTVAAVRALLGGLLLLAVLGPRWRLLLQPGTPKALVTQGFFNCILPWTLVAWASRTIDSGLATILNSLSPIFIFLFTWGITRHEPAPPRKFVGVVLGIAGVLVIIGIVHPSMRTIVAVTALAIFSTGAAFIVYFRLLSTIGSIATSSQAYLRIVVGVGLGVVFLGERLAPNTVAGLLLVVAGVVAMTLPSSRR